MSPSFTIPIIDAAALRAGSSATIAALSAACRRHGFFYLANHGIDPALIEAVFSQSRAFFAQPVENKQALHLSQSPGKLGYEPLRGQQLESGTPPDLKEGFYIGPDITAGDPRVQAGRFGYGPNQWPASLPAFRAVMNDYFAAATALCGEMMQGLALALGLPHQYFADFTTDAATRLRLLHYPPQPANPLPGEKGCGAHTDFGAVTLLLQDSSGGLQVQDVQTGAWVEAPPIEGCFVVNLGDLIARWTNHHFHSNPHRVINRSGSERYSVPFFFTGNPDYVVSCLPTCLNPGETPLYPPITTEQHLRDCYQRTYA